MYHYLVAKNANYKKSNHVQETAKNPSMIPEALRGHMTWCRAFPAKHNNSAQQTCGTAASIARAHIPCSAQIPQISKSIFDLDSSDKTRELIQRSEKNTFLELISDAQDLASIFLVSFFPPTNKTSGIKGTKENIQNLKLSC